MDAGTDLEGFEFLDYLRAIYRQAVCIQPNCIQVPRVDAACQFDGEPDLFKVLQVLTVKLCHRLSLPVKFVGTADLMKAKIASLPEDARSDAAGLLERITAQRERERKALLHKMQSSRYATLLDRLVDAARAPEVLRDLGSRPARKVARRLARKPWRRLCRSARDLGNQPPDAALHEVRRRAKQARYALEAVGTVTRGRASALADDAAAIQQALGDHQDRVVARAWLLDAAGAADQPREAFVAGEVAEMLSAEQADLRTAARRTWRAACKQPIP